MTRTAMRSDQAFRAFRLVSVYPGLAHNPKVAGSNPAPAANEGLVRALSDRVYRIEDRTSRGSPSAGATWRCSPPVTGV